MNVLVISNRLPYWGMLFPAFERQGLCPVMAGDFKNGLDSIRSAAPAAVIIDAGGAGADDAEAHINGLRSMVAEILQINAMVHAVAVSFLGEAELHDALEGLGVLCILPPLPREADIERLSQALQKVNGLMQP